MRNDNGLVIIKSLMNFYTPAGRIKPKLSFIINKKVDCDNRRYKRYILEQYSLGMGKGEVHYTDYQKSLKHRDWEYVAPNSLDGTELEIVCQYNQ